MSHLFSVSAGSTTHSSTAGSADGGAWFLFGVLGVCGDGVGSRRPVTVLNTHPAPPTKPHRALSTQSKGQTSSSHKRAERLGRVKTRLEKLRKAIKKFNCNVFMAEGENICRQVRVP